jgi:hypothetical protein
VVALADGADVYLLGTSLPSFWSVRLGEMRLTLGLSGWTANDWTGASALDQLTPPAEVGEAVLAGAPIEVLCEECGSRSSLPAAQRGSVQKCPRCRAYLDVGDEELAEGWEENGGPSS